MTHNSPIYSKPYKHGRNFRNLAKGFYQLEMHPVSIQKTAFSAKSGHYEYLRMPFGPKNAHASFQRCMNVAFRSESQTPTRQMLISKAKITFLAQTITKDGIILT